MVVPEHLLTAVKKIQDTILICPPVISQHAALGALEAGRAYCEEKIETIRSARSIVMNELEALGRLVTVPRADGAFYFLVRVETDMPPMTRVERLVREYGVGVLPGETFGIDGCAVRVAYGALTPETAREGIARFVRGLKGMLQ
jgi:aspartate/methionine/tyrosine aminotransferase